jgi:hypothetical protein
MVRESGKVVRACNLMDYRIGIVTCPPFTLLINVPFTYIYLFIYRVTSQSIARMYFSA